MRKSEYLEKLKDENKNHINNIRILIKTLDYKIERLKQSKKITDDICNKFEINCYNYNLVYEMNESRVKFINDLDELIKKINDITSRNSRNIDYDIQKISSINDLLYTYEVQLNNINKNDLSDIEKLQLNAIKKEIYEKFMRIKCEIDRDILKQKYDKLQNRNVILKALDNFFVISDMINIQRENLFKAIKGIDDYNNSLVEKSEPTREYKIIDILADIEIYLCQNRNDKNHQEQIHKIIDINDKINSVFSIDKKELKKAISENYKSKLPMVLSKNIGKMKRKQKKIIEFLYKNGYARSFEERQYKSKMEVLIKKLKLLSDNVEREINR